MRYVLLCLALLYAWLPPGMCACQLQATLLPRPDDSCPDDDDDGPGECQCVGKKHLCIAPAFPNLMASNSWETVVETPATELPDSLCLASALTPFYPSPASPLYVTLRALRI